MNPPKVVVALASSPDRLYQASETITSLMAQTRQPDEVALWLRGDIPADERLDINGLTVHHLDDTRPGAWLAATLREYPGAVIVTAADDRIYPSDWLALLHESFLRETAPFVHCQKLTGSLCPDGGWHLLAASPNCYREPTYLNQPEVAAGVLIPPVAVDLTANDAASAQSPSNDDTWLWLMAVLSRAKTKVVPGSLAAPDDSQAGQAIKVEAFLTDRSDTLEQKLLAEYELMVQVDAAHRVPFERRTEAYYKALDPALRPAELTVRYLHQTGMHLNLDNPRTLNEKIQWQKLYGTTPLMTRLADKYLVRDWVTEKIGSQYLIPLLGVWDRFDDIDFDGLPQGFALKANHGAAWNIIVSDRAALNIPDARAKFNEWMATDFGLKSGFQMQYSGIPPKIIAEQLLPGESIDDYKIWCFDGQVKYIWIDIDRTGDHKRVIYDTDWQPQPFVVAFDAPDVMPARPTGLETMVEIASELSKGFPQVRVDLYNVNGQIYFGEMTFTSHNGTRVMPLEFAYQLGDWTKLPEPLPISGKR